MAGEIGVMFNIPQPFTVRSRGLSQVIRINHHHLKQMVQPFSDDGKAIMYNFIQVWQFTINWLINLLTSTLTKYHCAFIISKFCTRQHAHTFPSWCWLFYSQYLKGLKGKVLEEISCVPELLGDLEVFL